MPRRQNRDLDATTGSVEQAAESPAEAPNGAGYQPNDAEILDEAQYQAAVRVLMDSEPQAVDTTEPEINREEEPSALEQVVPRLSLCVHIHTGRQSEDILATADVEINGICTIRNVKIKNSDYGPEVVMPRTKMPETGRFRDACVFSERGMRNQFDLEVMKAYQQTINMQQEQAEPEPEFSGPRMRM